MREETIYAEEAAEEGKELFDDIIRLYRSGKITCHKVTDDTIVIKEGRESWVSPTETYHFAGSDGPVGYSITIQVAYPDRDEVDWNDHRYDDRDVY